MGFSRRHGYAPGGFANQLQHTLYRAQETSILIELHALPTAREKERFLRKSQHVQKGCPIFDVRRHRADAGLA